MGVTEQEPERFTGDYPALYVAGRDRFLFWGIACGGCQRVTRHAMRCKNPACADRTPGQDLPLYLYDEEEVPDDRRGRYRPQGPAG